MYEREQYLLGLLIHIYEEYKLVFHILFIFLLIYIIIYTVIFFICMYRFSIKEKLPTWKFVTPIINWWYYFRLCKIPAWIAFIPVLNIIAHIVSPMNLAYQYKYKMGFGAFGVFFPFIQLPMIAFGPNKNRQEFNKATVMQQVKEIDEMEEKLEKMVEDDYEELDLNKLKNAKKTLEVNKTNEKIDKIELNAIKDDYEDVLYGDEMNQKTVAKIEKINNIVDEDFELFEANKETQEEEIVELDDDKDLKISIKDKEKDIENKSNIKIKDDADYKDYEFLKKENTTIAFGGQQGVQKKARNVTEEKYGRNRCPRCNTPINETMDICPGCGINLREN